MKTSSPSPSVYTIDLRFANVQNSIAVYLLPHDHGVALIETGPGSTLPRLQAGLQAHGYNFADITDVFITHIHLDHAGASGWLARQGARIHMHPAGAKHMLDPEKLIASAAQIYGDQMDTLWGEFLPVPPEQLSVLQDGQIVEIGNLCVQALETTGHAKHHFAYIARQTCFTGDIGGIRLPGKRHLRLPMPAPDLHLENWRTSLLRLQQARSQGAFDYLGLTHFGIFDDPDWHLTALQDELDSVEALIMKIMPTGPSIDEIDAQFDAWMRERSRQQGLTIEAMNTYETVTPSWMAAHGIQRYWRRYRQPETRTNK
jgi:glyoxylase-like metal-dependent hydrolase (beta-lactamase superfamily II)